VPSVNKKPALNARIYHLKNREFFPSCDDQLKHIDWPSGQGHDARRGIVRRAAALGVDSAVAQFDVANNCPGGCHEAPISWRTLRSGRRAVIHQHARSALTASEFAEQTCATLRKPRSRVDAETGKIEKTHGRKLFEGLCRCEDLGVQIRQGHPVPQRQGDMTPEDVLKKNHAAPTRNEGQPVGCLWGIFMAASRT